MTKDNNTPLSYRQAGVDIKAGEQLVSNILPLAKSTTRKGVMGGLGGFGALFDLKAEGWQDPVLVSGTDGVGTKLMLAFATGRHDTIGIDLVAMCANDVLAQGAEPLFFLDYFATGALDNGIAESVIAGIADGCRQAILSFARSSKEPVLAGTTRPPIATSLWAKRCLSQPAFTASRPCHLSAPDRSKVSPILLAAV